MEPTTEEAGAFAPLLARLDDPSHLVRRTSFEALLAVPLSDEAWRAVAAYVLEVLDDTERPERAEVIALAPRVPVRSVRERLAALALGGGRDALPAAIALAGAHDDRAVGPLLAAAERGNPDAVEALACVDVSSATGRVRAMLDMTVAVEPPEGSGTEASRAALYDAADAGLRRFWLALALARCGDDGPLRDFVEDHRAGRVELPLFWGQPEMGWARIRTGGPVPDVLRGLGYGGGGWDG